jgi:hypothetical protein
MAMRLNLRLLQSALQEIIPFEGKDLVIKASDISKFWSLFDTFVMEIKQEYVKKIPNGGSPSDNIVRAMAIGRIAVLEEILGEKSTKT